MMRPSRSQGLSLVELMVALALGLILLAGLAQMFISSKQGYRIQESTSRLQENARFAVNLIERHVHQADFWAGTEASNVTLSAGFSHGGTSGDCDVDYLFNPGAGRLSDGDAGIGGAGIDNNDVVGEPFDGGQASPQPGLLIAHNHREAEHRWCRWIGRD